eukprot:CAMPEP_0113951568 /NCGR_PEP_ID=MMETSP1339-20121228/86917_1 /TAXON_ID=94617 /ORGANISM="Fibrocapsa japonica" /LENGTH=243 /DNA_ID=CAMNT_0000959871 /DNA_START=198 /DNA_END=930 /DNA_ORIENTATION=+ /assembly_acc=CAM_ASM_000762
MGLASLFEAQRPVKLRYFAHHWPAVSDAKRKWSDLELLSSRTSGSSDSTVEIEIGKDYMDADVHKAEVSINSLLEFILQEKDEKDNKVSSSPGPNFYLAQHNLDDICVLRDDVPSQPEICRFSGKGHVYLRNIWLGGHRGTVSPCHYDPFNNILVQIFGEKTVTLFPPHVGKWLYPAKGTLQPNTSLVDIRKPDLEKYPIFEKAWQEALQATLYPGDAVFIPFKWWHHCNTKNLSCSVNYWWL